MMIDVGTLWSAIREADQRQLKVAGKETVHMDVAILDDYQAVAEQMADWSQLPSNINVRFFHDHIAAEEEAVPKVSHAYEQNSLAQ